ncbi:preprotein translocase subunit SecG [Pacificimonas sp. WHA3]|uniref:Protein-export membrane protein SecG n=1 Tax=Pacificimonas pallii TaxID=2827236 RepID=A0ABS6SE47_9SPHN|nr:preprotein translocase subunit SecG [Pacificimonas pallii]MBV7256530.1 preprotein translocase subunit SecG [Pacificimonas pallii]
MSDALNTFVLVIHSLLAVALVSVILMQKSEGGALGIGGGPGGLMSARGAGNLLTKATAWLAVIFIGTSLALAILAANGRDISAIDTSLASDPTAAAPGIADDVQGTDADDPALATPAPALDDVPFAIPGSDGAAGLTPEQGAATDEDVPLAQ